MPFAISTAASFVLGDAKLKTPGEPILAHRGEVQWCDSRQALLRYSWVDIAGNGFWLKTASTGSPKYSAIWGRRDRPGLGRRQP